MFVGIHGCGVGGCGCSSNGCSVPCASWWRRRLKVRFGAPSHPQLFGHQSPPTLMNVSFRGTVHNWQATQVADQGYGLFTTKLA